MFKLPIQKYCQYSKNVRPYFNMKKSTILFLFLKFYRLLWLAALPILRKNRRLREGIKERTSSDHFKRADIWIQAASAGECNLAVQIVRTLYFKDCPCFQKTKKILITSTTSQGFEILNQNLSKFNSSQYKNISNPDNISQSIHINQITWFPFDIPDLMENVICKVKPSIVVLLETELWPSLLSAAKKYGVKVVVINGRMSAKSHRNYTLTKWLWNKIEPYAVIAISDTDAQRFKDIFPNSIVDVMPNIKFDSIIPNSEGQNTVYAADISNIISEDSNSANRGSEKNREEIIDILPAGIRFSILASVRKEEEEDALEIITQILKKFPNQVVGLFPRHTHRVNNWQKRLSDTAHKWQLASEIYNKTYKTKKPISSGTVILWDRFGELKNAYSFATVAFVGGSLKPLGGHNFIEPLTSGAVTVTGPYVDDFAWAGDEIFSHNIVKKADDCGCVADFMVKILKNPPDREDVLKKAVDYIEKKQGGTEIACNTITTILQTMDR